MLLSGIWETHTVGIKNLDRKQGRRVEPILRAAPQGAHRKQRGGSMQVLASAVDSASPAVKLVHWLSTRTSVDPPITAEDISSAIGSRRYAKTVIAAAIKLGFLQQKDDKFIVNCTKITTKTNAKTNNIPDAKSVGQIGVPLSPPVQPSTTLTGMTGSLGIRKPVATQSQDLRVRQTQRILGSKAPTQEVLESACAPALCTRAYVSPKGIHNASGTLISSNQDILNTNNIYISDAGTRSKPRASSPKEIAKKETKQAIKTSQFEQQTNRMRSVITAAKVGQTQSALFSDEKRAYGIALAYEEFLGIYLHKPTLKYLIGRVNSSSPNFKRWLAAADEADALGVEYSWYVKAQFWWFDKSYSRAPKPYEISGGKGLAPAQERFQQFQDAAAAGELKPAANVVGRVVATLDTTTKAGRSRMATVRASEAVRFQNSERALLGFMKNYNATDEWVFKNFAKGPMAAQYFDLQWLRKHPTYLRLRASGEL